MKTSIQLIVSLILVGMLSIGSIQAQDGPDKNGIYGIVDDIAEYHGGPTKMYEFLFSNIKYPEAAVKSKVEGTVYIKFIVKKDGTVSNPEVLKGVKELNDEALRVIKAMPKWKAGKVKDEAVDSYMTLPIKFSLS